FTKGDDEEQRLKISRSPLASEFAAHIIEPEKTPQTYRDIVATYDLDATRTWMIGNSLRSDIQPALAAGINAAYIPNPHTWHMEHLDFEHDVSWPGTYVQLQAFPDLLREFTSTGQ